jgi:hypothetical protein
LWAVASIVGSVWLLVWLPMAADGPMAVNFKALRMQFCNCQF